VQLGLENKKKATWAAVLGAVAVLAAGYQIIPWFTGSSTSASNVPVPIPNVTPAAKRPGAKGAKKPHLQSLDPTLRLDLLASSEQTQYEGNGRNIFVSQAEAIPQPVAMANTDANQAQETYHVPLPPQAPPIPLKFYGFASRVGEPKKIFLKLGEDVFVAGEGEIVDRRYKVIRISATSVEIQDVVNSGPPQSLPLTQG
jgi:hypothetical protein